MASNFLLKEIFWGNSRILFRFLIINLLLKRKIPPTSISPNLLPLCDCALENSKLLLSKLNNLLEQIGKKIRRINRILKSCFFLVIKINKQQKKIPSVVHTLFFSKKKSIFAR